MCCLLCRSLEYLLNRQRMVHLFNLCLRHLQFLHLVLFRLLFLQSDGTDFITFFSSSNSWYAARQLMSITILTTSRNTGNTMFRWRAHQKIALSNRLYLLHSIAVSFIGFVLLKEETVAPFGMRQLAQYQSQRFKNPRIWRLSFERSTDPTRRSKRERRRGSMEPYLPKTTSTAFQRR